MRDAHRAGVYHASRQAMPALLAAAEAAGLATFRVDLAAVRDKRGLFERLDADLNFPDWFGHNWDALADCLGDLSWLPAEGYLVLLEHCEGIADDDPADFATALEVFAVASDAWREARVPFWVLTDLRIDGITSLPEFV
ncbi:MAG: barstar family protein [Rhodocyclaceae bacterium]